MARYIFKAGAIELHSPRGTDVSELWIGIEYEGPINLDYLSRHGYDLIPASGMSEEELRSVGVDHFEAVYAVDDG